MDELAARLSDIALDPEVSITYEAAFNNLVLFAENVRGQSIPSAELDVTKRLASPFNPGGLLILLEEPRPSHPWGEGIDRVISTCNTLDALNEGIQIASQGRLGLTHDVSVVDMRPFLSKKQYGILQDDEWNSLHDLVCLAIKAKRPEVLLCMGDVAKYAIKSRMTTQPGIRQRCQCTEIVYAMHPSHSVNYNEADADTRKKLFQSIIKTCYKLRGLDDSHISEEQFRENVLVLEEMPAPLPESKIPQRTKCLERFLEVLLRSCFKPNHILPGPNVCVGTSSRYKLNPWHENWLRHVEKHLNSSEDRKDQARALLTPVFKQLNNSFRRSSWFLPIYDVCNWPHISGVFAGRFHEIENACYLLAGDTAVDTDFSTNGRSNGSECREQWRSAKMEEIIARATKLWGEGEPHPQRRCKYSGLG